MTHRERTRRTPKKKTTGGPHGFSGKGKRPGSWYVSVYDAWLRGNNVVAQNFSSEAAADKWARGKKLKGYKLWQAPSLGRDGLTKKRRPGLLTRIFGKKRVSRDPEKTRDYEYYVYPEARVSGPGVKVPRGSSRSSWDLTEAKRVAKKMGSPAAIYSISKGRFVGYIHRNGRFIAFR